jgi:hypothetical protein
MSKWYAGLLEVDRCARKQPFLSQMLADNFARLLEIKHADGVPRFTYHCDVCEQWHTTRRAPE